MKAILSVYQQAWWFWQRFADNVLQGNNVTLALILENKRLLKMQLQSLEEEKGLY